MPLVRQTPVSCWEKISFETLNGVKASGGSIDAASIVAADGYLFAASGYGMFGQMPGNVLLAFKPRAAK